MSTSTLVKPKDEGAKGRGRPRCEDARQRILEAAAEVMEERGFTSSTTDEISERAGASKATIYRWWPTKASLLAEALRDAVGREMPFPYTGDFKEDIRKQLRNFAALLSGPRGRVFRAFLIAAQSDPDVANAYLTEWVQPRRRDARSVLERYTANGTLPSDTDFEVLLDSMYGPFYLRVLRGHGRISPAYADSIADLVLHGVPHRTSSL